MPNLVFAWERFWVPRGERLTLHEGAYLPDPTTEWGTRLNPRVVPASYFDDRPCVVFLGDTAMGKTTAVMQVERQGTDSRIRAVGGVPLRERLGRFASDALLVTDVFRSPELTELSHRDRPVYLYLDDFDECLLRVRTLPRLLVDELRRLPPDAVRQRLRLRVVCRTSVWPDGLTAALGEFWGDSGVDVFELAPLRVEDVRLAACETGIDPAAFLTEVRRLGVQGFASRPLTLQRLLTRFGRGEDLPLSQAEIFEGACLDLVAAFDPAELGARRPSRLAPDDRLAIASRLAAAAMFSGREFVRADPTAGAEGGLAVALRDVAGHEVLHGRRLEVGELELEEVLRTGLFAGPDESGRLRWAHRSYAEYLAARYLVEQDAGLAQVRSLVVHPGDPDGRLVPPLHETAAWLAGMRPDIFVDVLRRDPIVLLSTDAAGIDPGFRTQLVDALLSRYDAGELLPPDGSTYERLRNLAHPGLGGQLAPWIRHPSRSQLARAVAIDIAGACRETAVLGDLVQTALSVGDDVRIRTLAAAVVAEYGDAASKAALLPLVAGDPNDPDDQIKGAALKATWPAHLPTARLFEVLTPSRPNLLGFYRSFLLNNPFEQLRTEDIPLALAWIDRQLGPAELPYDVEDLVAEILLVAARSLDDPAVAAAFGPVAWRRLTAQHRLLDRSSYLEFGGGETDEQLGEPERRAVVAVLVGSSIAAQADIRDLVYAGLVVPDDVPWLLEQVGGTDDSTLRRAWARLIDWVLPAGNGDHLDAVRSAALTDDILRAETERWLDPEELVRRSAEWAEMRSRWAERAEPRFLDPSPQERVERRLEAAEAGDLDAWWGLNLDLTLDPASTHYGDEYEPDLTVLPGWQAADEPARERIARAGLAYVRQRTPEPDRWFASDTIFRPDWAGYRAFHLLWRLADARLAEIEPAIWTRWAPVLVGFHTLQGAGDEAPQQALVRMAYAHAPDEVLETLRRLALAIGDASRLDAEHVLRKVAGCWDDRLATALRDLLTEPGLPARVAGAILRPLLEYGDVAARDLGAEWVAGPLREGVDRERALEAAVALTIESGATGWQPVWVALEADPEFGEQVLARLVWRDSFAEEVGARLTTSQLGALYGWLEWRYPEAEDPDEPGMHEVTFREQIGRWRDGLLAQLARPGDAEAVEALRVLAEEFPTLEKVRRALVRAKEAARVRTWLPPSPREVLALTEESERRLVRNAEQLLDAVAESLARLGQRFQAAESRAAADLWNVVGRATARGVAKGVLANLRGKLGARRSEFGPELTIDGYWREFGVQVETVNRPKNELLMSDYVKRHLDADLAGRGLVVNREVQNRPGDITDIRVEAFARDERGREVDRLTVVVEVKGCWHRDLETAMVGQLADRYLQPEDLRHGLYLVGWFDPDGWDPNDRRRQRAVRHALAPLRDRLEAQAQGLAQRGLAVRAFVLDASLPAHIQLEPPGGQGDDD